MQACRREAAHREFARSWRQCAWRELHLEPGVCTDVENRLSESATHHGTCQDKDMHALAEMGMKGLVCTIPMFSLDSAQDKSLTAYSLLAGALYWSPQGKSGCLPVPKELLVSALCVTLHEGVLCQRRAERKKQQILSTNYKERFFEEASFLETSWRDPVSTLSSNAQWKLERRENLQVQEGKPGISIRSSCQFSALNPQKGYRSPRFLFVGACFQRTPI